MKTKHLSKSPGIALIIVLCGNVSATPPTVPRDSISYEQLVLARRKADMDDPMKRMTTVAGPDPSVVNRPPSLLASSDIISFGSFSTLVPKRAILQIPQKYADRVKLKPNSPLQSWKDFYAANRGWITTVEVTRPQAEGAEPIPENMKKIMTKSGNLVVATYLSGPISVLVPKESVEKSIVKSNP